MLATYMTYLLCFLRILVGNGDNFSSRNCTAKYLAKAKLEAAACFDKDFKLLYLEANHLLVKSTPQSTDGGIIGRALGLSKRNKLTTIQLKVLADVIHYHVTKKPLLKSRRSGGTEQSGSRHNDVVSLGSDILDQKNMKILQDLSKEFPIGERMLYDFDKFAARKMSQLQNSTYASKAKNIEFEAFPCQQITENYTFMPFKENRTTRDEGDVISVPASIIINNGTDCAVSALYFKTLQKILPSKNSFYPQQNLSNSSEAVNSRIISLSFLGAPKNNLSNPVKITLLHLEREEKFVQKGVFWNFTNGYDGYWSDSGCDVIYQRTQSTTFECNHLTNFAILVTGKLKPSNISIREYVALSTISTVGCFLSMIGEIVTLAVYAVTKVQSKRRFILINTVLCLVLAQAIFLAGIDQAKKQKFLCALIASMISYFFLASFCWMMNMAIHLYITTSQLFAIQHHFSYFMISGYVVPMIYIILAASSTRGHGFGTSKFCWLDSENGAIWIFLGPVAVILMVNIILTIFVLVRILSTKRMQDAKTFRRIKQIIRAVIILTPSLGFAWIFGLFTVSSDDVTMQFIFAVLNSFQGIFILINCCILDRKVRQEMFGLIRHPSRVSSRVRFQLH